MTSIVELVQLIFKNDNNTYFNLNLDGLNNAFELFSFYVNLVSQAVYFLSGQTNIEEIEERHLKEIMRRLRFLGVEFRIDVLQKPDCQMGIFIVRTGTGESLGDFSLHIIASNALYIARFGLFHNVPPFCKQVNLNGVEL